MTKVLALLVFTAGTAMADVSALGLYTPFDSSDPAGTGWTSSMARNDDGSSSEIALGFDFCFYEVDRSSVYINNNGNLTFGSSLSGYTSTGFPESSVAMIAPFWADVDTRSTTGVDSTNTNLVWHKFIDLSGDGANDTLVVTWDGVGYYSANNTHRNTFQVAISGVRNAFGGSPLGPGFNAMFSYGNMDWTTGSASGGDADGLGGTAATVGINEGGIFPPNGRYDQIGRYDHRGTDYNGNGVSPFVTNGVDGLDYRDYFFDACLGIVPTPGTLALVGMGGLMMSRRRRN